MNGTAVTETGRVTQAATSVVIVAPNEQAAHEIRASLDVAEGFRAAVLGYDGGTAEELEMLDTRLILLAICQNEREGLAACRHLRAAYSLPIVVCSRNHSEQSIVRAFNAGADDYLVLPAPAHAFAVRLRAVLRRAADWPVTQAPQPILASGQFEVRLDERTVLKDGRAIDLSPIEFRLLEALMRRAAQLITHSQLLAEVWGPQYVDSRNYLRLYIQYLREKIEADPRQPKYLINEWGVGYRFEPGQAAALPGAPQAAA